jgi:uncharacterized protein YqhQ
MKTFSARARSSLFSPLRTLRFATLWLMGVDSQSAEVSASSRSSSDAEVSDPFLSGPRPSESIGGQAVIEGVMMRSPRRLAVAVRAPDGQIVVDNRVFVPYARRHWLLAWPVLRGAASLIESLALGLRALNFSIAVQERGTQAEANQAAKGDGELAASANAAKAGMGVSTDMRGTGAPSEVPAGNSKASEVLAAVRQVGSESEFSKPSSGKDKLLIAVSLGISFLLAMGLFQLLPYFVSGHIVGGSKLDNPNPLLFNSVAGAVRMTLLLAYLTVISRLPDVARVFQYHGAEHKSIFAHEHGRELTSDMAARESRFHPRCGTSFILIVALVCICFFSVLDALFLQMGFHYANFGHRFLVHLPFVPFVAGLAFEVLKLSARFQNSVMVRPLVLPGLWLQRITTREPDAKQMDVAIASIHASLA